MLLEIDNNKMVANCLFCCFRTEILSVLIPDNNEIALNRRVLVEDGWVSLKLTQRIAGDETG